LGGGGYVSGSTVELSSQQQQLGTANPLRPILQPWPIAGGQIIQRLGLRG
jgi:hypothetical protein